MVAPEGAMDACYYSIIERAENGHFAAWVPDLPGVTADGRTEDEVVQRLFSGARERLRNLIMRGDPVPPARPVDELPQRNGQRVFRRLLLIIS
jgi:predicted RNase H-like HicB family nuclease